MHSVIAVGIGIYLIVSALAKLLAPSSRAALSVFGISATGAQWLAWGAAIAVELALGALLIAGFSEALIGASALFGIFTSMQLLAIRRGAAGRACGCLGNRGSISWGAALGNACVALLALAGFAITVFEPSDRTLVMAGFALLTLVVVALVFAVAALARELGIIRLALQSKGAIEIENEGPPLGTRMELGRWFDTADRDLALAVFTSPSCPVCKTLAPSIEFVARDSQLAVLTFDEEVDRDAWDAFDAPGSPYAVALDLDGTVLAKGVPNSLPELESVIATALRRRSEVAGV